MVLNVVLCKISSFQLEGNNLARTHSFLSTRHFFTSFKGKRREKLYWVFYQHVNHVLVQGARLPLHYLLQMEDTTWEACSLSKARMISKGLFSYLYMEQFFLSRLKVKRQGYKSCTQLHSPHSLPSKRTCELRMRIRATHSALILWVAKCRAVALQLSKRCKEWNKNPQRNIFCICTSRKILSICV